MKNSILYVGIDVHAEKAVIAVYKDGEKEAMSYATVRNEKSAVKKFFTKLKEKEETKYVSCCYEAGFSGFEMQRYLEEMGIACVVAAPSRIPHAKGDRIKTDRRDAMLLARTLRNGDIVPVHVPNMEDETVREYLRMRDNFKQDAKAKKQQILAMLHRRGFRWSRTNWSLDMRKWLCEIDFGSTSMNTIRNEYYTALVELEEKITRMDEEIERIASEERYAEPVSQLRCFRGAETLTALNCIVEIGDFRRFTTAEKFMSFLGLTPSEHSSGERRSQGGLTKAGNSHLRRLLVESSWHSAKLYDPCPSKRLIRRREGQPAHIVQYADKAGRRLIKKYRRMVERGKPKTVAVTAVARELAGFIWGMMTGHHDVQVMNG